MCERHEIAERTGTPLGTVKTRMQAGMRRLQGSLGAPVGVPAPRGQGSPACGTATSVDTSTASRTGARVCS